MTLRRALKNIGKKILPEKVVDMLRHVPFDNTYPWLNHAFKRLISDGRCKERPQYAWGVVQGAAIAKVLEIPRISVIEFGVAGGFGLLALENAAQIAAAMTNVDIDVFGFDTGVGLPRPEDFRDQPNMWFEGQLPMDRQRLRAVLKRASLHLGPVRDTVPSFIAGRHAPVGFVSFDLDLYSSTCDALALFQSDYSLLLPRVISYFDDIYGHSYNDFCGERLAIREFNDRNPSRKISPIYGLRYFLPRSAFFELWPDGMYFAHFFEHPLHGVLDSVNKGMFMPIEGTVVDAQAGGVRH